MIIACHRRRTARRAGLQCVSQLRAVGRVHAEHRLSLAARQDAGHLPHGSAHPRPRQEGRANSARRSDAIPAARTRNGPKRRNWAGSATCSSRTWTTCPMCRRACTLRRPARSSWATIRKSASASSIRRWTNTFPAPRGPKMSEEENGNASAAHQLRSDLRRGVARHGLRAAGTAEAAGRRPAVRTRVFRGLREYRRDRGCRYPDHLHLRCHAIARGRKKCCTTG